MNFLAQALQERATQLSYEADESVEDVGDMADVDSDKGQVRIPSSSVLRSLY